MKGGHRQAIIKAVTFLAGLYFFFEWVMPAAVLKQLGVDKAHESITNGFITVGIMAIGLGLINLFMVYGSKVVFRRPGWINAGTLLFSLLFMLGVAAGDWIATERLSRKSAQFTHLGTFAQRILQDSKENVQGVPPRSERVASLVDAASRLVRVQVDAMDERQAKTFDDKKLGAQYSSYLTDIQSVHTQFDEQLAKVSSLQSDQALEELSVSLQSLGVLEGQVLRLQYNFSMLNNLWRFLFDGLFVSLSTAMFSLLGVYIASAAYRAFRIRSFESVLMMSAAVLVMLGQIPFGVYVYSEMPEVRDWILRVPNSAAFRAITIGTAIAGLVMAFRMWFSIESDFGSEDL